jgi:uncharacterized protein YutE (UPF0331/DUF86 family)
LTYLEWSAKLIDSLAWPITSIILVVLLRSPLSDVLLTISKLKFKGLEVDFSKEKEAVNYAAQKVQNYESRLPEAYKEPEFLDEARQISRISPESAIMLTWKNIDAELAATAHRNGMQLKSRSPVSSQKVIYTLQGENILDENIVNLILAMRDLRNKAVHGHSETVGLTERDALSYIENASLIIHALQNAKT